MRLNKTLIKIVSSVVAVILGIAVLFYSFTYYMINVAIEDGYKVGIVNAYNYVLGRAVFMSASDRELNPQVMSSVTVVKCKPETFDAAKLRILEKGEPNCRVALSYNVEQRGSVRCRYKVNENCIYLSFDENFYGLSEIRPVILDALHNPCSFLMDSLTLESMIKRGAADIDNQFGQRAFSNLLDQRIARGDLGCDVTPLPKRKVIIEHGEKIDILTTSSVVSESTP